MPKQCVDYLSGKVKPRRTVGVRMPGDAICQVPLLATVSGFPGHPKGSFRHRVCVIP